MVDYYVLAFVATVTGHTSMDVVLEVLGKMLKIALGRGHTCSAPIVMESEPGM